MGITGHDGYLRIWAEAFGGCDVFYTVLYFSSTKTQASLFDT